METLIELNTTDVEHVVATIWATTIARPVAVHLPPLPAPAEDAVSSAVTIAGDWNGVVVFQCPPVLARTLTGAMFGLPPASVQHVDVEDALGELTNMMAGNIKALLPGTNHLGLPVVALGGPHRVSVPTSAPLHHLGFRCEAQVFTLTIVERTA
ncbi:MAG: chemotaxis protein CheX [Bacteroidota bacterium]